MAPGLTSTPDHDLPGGRRNRTRRFPCRGHDDTLEDVFERFTDRARRVLTDAQEEARQLNHPFIGTEHILLGLLREDDGVGAHALRSLGVSFKAVRDQVQEVIGTAGTVPSGSPPFTPRAKKVLELALREALQLNHSYIGTEHILLGLVREGQGVAATVLVSLGADLHRVRQEVNSLIAGGQETPGGRSVGAPHDAPAHHSPSREPRCPGCGDNVTEAARFRTIVVPPDEGNADSLSLRVVYCMHCGTALHMGKADGAS
jgi:ATP-dependent Clp protease ATP-binding subunit ClpC